MPSLKNRKHIFRTLFALLVIALLLPSAASAEGLVSFKIAPTMFDDKIEPGSDHDFMLTVTNQGDAPSTLYPSVRNITGVGSDSHPIYATEKNANEYELASWVAFQEKELMVNPGQSQVLHFTVRFPADAHPGAHMAGLFLSDKADEEIKNGSGIGFEIGAILSFQISGDIVENTQIREFFSEKTVYGASDVRFTMRIENQGNVLVKPHGLIDITNMFGRKVGTLPVNDSLAAVFPKATRDFSAEWKPEDFQFGRYEAVLSLAVEGVGGTQSLTRIVQFWILPMDVVIPVVGGLLALVLVVYVLLKLYIRRQLAGVRLARRQSTSGLSRLTMVVMALLIAIILGLLGLFVMM